MAAGRAVEWSRQVCAALNNRDLAAVAGLLAEDCSYAANGAPHWKRPVAHRYYSDSSRS
jgi:hypothetical protein